MAQSKRIAGGRRLAAALSLALLASCARSSAVGTLRFENRAPVWRVNDRVDTPAPPHNRPFANLLYHFDGFFFKRMTRLMDVTERRHAENVNSLDEVPDSTWFTNRIGVRDMTVDEVRAGPRQGEGPDAHRPWTILGTKVGGVSVGFIIEDQRGWRYLLKFDVKGVPEMETAADVIVQRILWACGYNVPEDDIVYFRRADLVLGKDAEVRDPFGNKRAMTEADLELALSKIEEDPDGRIRGLVSKFVAGKPLGGYGREGVRDDDPNDLVAHEHRRDLRGAHPIFAWLGHTDIKEGNTLDVWVGDPADPAIHYVVHYLIDFGKSLGVLAYIDRNDSSGFAHAVDFGSTARSALSFGLWMRPWDDISAPPLTGVGLYESDNYDPGEWKSHAPFFPFTEMDRFDGFWGAKILVRFTRDQLRAVVEEAKLSDPKAAEYMLDTLVRRQRKTARYWFERVAPLDRFEVVGGQLCFEDLAVRYGLHDEGAVTRFSVVGYDYAGHKTGWATAVAPDDAGRACAAGLEPSGSPFGYTIARVAIARGGNPPPPVLVHLARAPDGDALRVIGLVRK